MASCDMCSKPATTKARIEGAIMSVCSSCALFGTSMAPPKLAGKVFVPLGARTDHASFGLRKGGNSYTNTEFVLSPDFGQKLRNARNRLKLTEEEAALKLQVTKNDLLHYESGKRQPTEVMTRKLEKFYTISLELKL